MKIGFIGLGIMGKPMAKNLLKAGYDLSVNTRKQAVVDELVVLGARAASRQELGETCDVIFTMLPNGPEVTEVMLGDNGVANYMKPGSIFVDSSSIDPMVSQKIASVLAQRGVEMLDAPVSGGEPKAIDGTLAFMVGGKAEVFAQVKDVLLTMGSSATLCGEVGAGNTTKLVNQIIVAANIQALAEGLTFAKKAGVNAETVFQAIKGGLAGSTVMNAKAPMMISDDSKPGFRIDLHIKDMNNVLSCAHAVGAYVPIAAQAQEVFQWLHNNGCGQCDHSAMVKFYKALDHITTLE